MNKNFHGIDIAARFEIAEKNGYGVSLAVSDGSAVETFCVGSGRFGQDFPVNPEMLFQAGSVSKTAFAMMLLRFADRGEIELDADISAAVSDFAEAPLTFSALLSHTAGFNVHGFDGYPAAHGYHQYPEHAAAGLWTTPAELTKIGIALGRSYCEGGLLKRETAVRMAAPVLENYGLCLFRQGGAAWHEGCNEGFLTLWMFSLTDDFCAAGMVNRDDEAANRNLWEVLNPVFARQI